MLSNKTKEELQACAKQIEHQLDIIYNANISGHKFDKYTKRLQEWLITVNMEIMNRNEKKAA